MTSEGVLEASWTILEQLEEQAPQTGQSLSKQDDTDNPFILILDTRPHLSS